jgi:hypothetical protein
VEFSISTSKAKCTIRTSSLAGNPINALEILAHSPPEKPYDDIQLLGRDRSYDDTMQCVMDRMRIVQSSNVYGYYYEFETTPERGGILYVTFLAGEGDCRSGRGATYAYYDVPLERYRRFQNASAISAGNAVWEITCEFAIAFGTISIAID